MGESLVIINPLSGPGRRDLLHRAQTRRALAERAIDGAGLTARVEVTGRPGHARELARDAVSAGALLVVAWGGDGTVNEVAGVLAFTETALGVVPAGSGNGLARTLGMSLDPARALTQVFTGTTRTIDAGDLSGRLFFNVAGVGFDAHVAGIFNRPGSRRGFGHYVSTSLIELFRYRHGRYVVHAEDAAPLEQEALMVVLANGAEYGNGARVAPDARLDDGLIDVVLVEPQPAWRAVLRSRHLFDGSIARRPGVRTLRTAKATITGAGRLAFHADGEVFEHEGPLELRVHRGALRVRVP